MAPHAQASLSKRPPHACCSLSRLRRRGGFFAWLLAFGVLAPGLPAAPKIGVVLKSSSTFWSLVAAGAQEAGQAADAEIVVRSPDSESEVDTQIQMFTALAGEGCEVIVLAPCSKDALVEPVAAAVARRVKVVILETRLAKDVAPVFVGTDHVETGRAAGRIFAQTLADGDHVGLLRHNQSGGPTEQRETGALEALRTGPNLEVRAGIYASTEPGTETSRASLLLNQDSQIKGIIASGTPGAMAMLHVLRERGLTGKVQLIGFGYNLNRNVADAIAKGSIAAWVAQLPRETGRVGVETAVALARGDAVSPVVDVPFQVITPANQQDPAVRALIAE